MLPWLEISDWFVGSLARALTHCLVVLFFAAGVIFAGDLSTTYPQDYDYLMDINMRTPFIFTQFFLEYLRETRGCVINVFGIFTQLQHRVGLQHLLNFVL